MFSCERFHPYIYDKTVEVHSDYKPFEYILKNHLATAPAILQRMPLRLQKYDNNLVYKRWKLLQVADTLSRAQLAETTKEIREEEMRSKIDIIHSQTAMFQWNSKSQETSRDPLSQKIVQVLQNGWPLSKKALPDDLKEYWKYKSELSENGWFLLKHRRSIILSILGGKILEKLHKGHPGIHKTKQCVRQTVFWPRMNQDIENFVSKCSHC